MPQKNIFEEAGIALSVKPSVSIGSTVNSVKFKFSQTGGASKLADTDGKLDAKSGEYKALVIAPKTKNDEDNYKLSFDYECKYTPLVGGPKTVTQPGSDTYMVWPATVNIKGTKDPDCKAEVKEFIYSVAYASEQGKSFETDDTLSRKDYPLKLPTSFTIGTFKPYYIKEWTKKVGRDREATVGKLRWLAEIKSPADGKKEGTPRKQYVNLTGVGEGSLLEVQVGPTDLSLGVKDEEIKLRVTFPKTNSKRNNPLPALWLDQTNTVAQTPKKATAKPGVDDLVYEAVLKLPNDKAAVTFYVQLGVAGCDKCKVEVGRTDAYDDDFLYIETWRKIYYHVTRPTSLACPSLAEAEAAFKKVGIEFEEYAVPAAVYADNAAWIPAGAWLDESVFKKGKAGNVLCIGTHNITEFEKKFDKSKSPAAHLILCHYQLDAETVECDVELKVKATDKIDFPPLSGTKVNGCSLDATTVNASCIFFKKALHNGGDPIVKVSWESTKDNSKKGDIDVANIRMDQAEWDNFVHVKLPDEAVKLFLDALKKPTGDEIKVRIQVYWSKGWYAGWCTTKRHNVIKASSAEKTVNCTIVHEVGHAIDQTVTATNVPSGLKPAPPTPIHSRQYTGRGHSGSHCATGVSLAKYNDTTKTMMALGANSEAKCTMYGCAMDNMDFCAECTPFAIASNPTQIST